MKGYKFLRDGDVLQKGDEAHSSPKRWQVIGSHMYGTVYTRKYIIVTCRRPLKKGSHG